MHVVDRGGQIADLGEALWNRDHVEVLRLYIRKLVPLDRRRHGRAGPRTDAVRRRDRAVAGVLVVVDEDALAALFLPPVGRDLAGKTALELAAERDRRM